MVVVQVYRYRHFDREFVKNDFFLLNLANKGYGTFLEIQQLKQIRQTN